MSKTTRAIGLFISDPHCGYDLGLTNPETKLIDTYGIEHPIGPLNESQTFIWDAYMTGLEQTKSLAGRDPIHVFILGDVTHGTKIAEQQMSTRMSDQIIYAADAIGPVLRLGNIKSCRIAFGTGWHVFGQGSSEILLSTILKDRNPKIDIRSLYHGLAYIEKYSIDYSHHGPPPGSRNWLKGNVARLYLQSKMMDDLDANQTPANLVVRGHYHQFTKAWYGLSRGGNRYESWLAIMPPLCLPGDYTRKVTSSVYRASPGVVAVELVNDKLLDMYDFTKTIDLRLVEEL